MINRYFKKILKYFFKDKVNKILNKKKAEKDTQQ